MLRNALLERKLYIFWRMTYIHKKQFQKLLFDILLTKPKPAYIGIAKCLHINTGMDAIIGKHI